MAKLFKITYRAMMVFIIITIASAIWSITHLTKHFIFGAPLEMLCVIVFLSACGLAMIAMILNVYAARCESVITGVSFNHVYAKRGINILPKYKNAPGPPPAERQKTFKVKILKCSDPERYWYYDKIGEIYECTLHENESMFWPTLMIYKTVALVSVDGAPPQRSNLLPVDVDVIYMSTSPV